MKPQQIRQGDVQLQPVDSLPAGCTEVPADGNRIVLAYGQATGHAHAIYDHMTGPVSDAASNPGGAAARAEEFKGATPGAADETAEADTERAQPKARLLRAPRGERFLEVKEAVTLRHEEHAAHTLPPGIYKLPTQVEYTPAELLRVAD